jgi:hypothetical protein
VEDGDDPDYEDELGEDEEMDEEDGDYDDDDDEDDPRIPFMFVLRAAALGNGGGEAVDLDVEGDEGLGTRRVLGLLQGE